MRHLRRRLPVRRAALRPRLRARHENRATRSIDLLATSAIERDTEITYVRHERDWLERAQQQGRFLDTGRMLPVLPASVAGNGHGGNGHEAHGGNGQHAH